MLFYTGLNANTTECVTHYRINPSQKLIIRQFELIFISIDINGQMSISMN